MSSDPSATQPVSGTFETSIDVRWGDLDALRHVNNAVYFSYFEEAEVRLFTALGLDGIQARPRVLAHTACDFLRPLMYPARVVVGAKIVRIGRTSVELDYWIAAAGDPEILHARSRSVLVCVDAETGRPAPWTDAERQAMDRSFAA